MPGCGQRAGSTYVLCSVLGTVVFGSRVPREPMAPFASPNDPSLPPSPDSPRLLLGRGAWRALCLDFTCTSCSPVPLCPRTTGAGFSLEGSLPRLPGSHSPAADIEACSQHPAHPGAPSPTSLSSCLHPYPPQPPAATWLSEAAGRSWRH